MAGRTKSGTSILDRFGGDKVVWIIVLCLFMFSLVSIFSSTSLLATKELSRLAIAKNQLLTAAVGIIIIFVTYKIRSVKLYKAVSVAGLFLSLLMLFLLVGLSALQKRGSDFGFIKAVELNGAYRWLKIAGIQISVYEFVKVFMVMYVAWATDYVKNARIRWTNSEFVKELVYLYVPVLLTSVLVLVGGTSSGVFMAGILLLTMLFGGVKFKNVLIVGGFCLFMFGGCFLLYQATKNTSHPMFNRFATVISRSIDYEARFKEAERGSKEWYEALDKIRQPYGAKIAMKEGGLLPLGKGPGQSTQKYKVAVIYEDYMFSFIVEEYGLIGGIFVIILYISLMARATIITRYCQEDYQKVLVAGLTILIVGQAMFHIVINCDLGILTGQTLPLISHGRSSFICFCFAFGMILSMSRKTEKIIEKKTEDSDPLIDLEISENE